MRLTFVLIASLCPLCLGDEPALPSRAEPHRSPIDVAILPGGRLALTANHGADSVSLVDLDAGKVVAEERCGRRPAAVAVSADGKRAAVSNGWAGSVTLFEIQGSSLKQAGEAAVGYLPRGLVFDAEDRGLNVAVAGADEVVQIDWASRKVTQRWPAPREPRHLLLSADGKWLAAGSSRSGQVRCWNTASRQLHWQRTIDDGFNLRALAFSPDGQDIVCAHVVKREFPVSKENIEEGWVIDSRLTKLARAAEARPFSWQVALDTKGQAVGDPHGIAFGPDGQVLAVTAAGTHELLLLPAVLPWNAGDPGDFVDPELGKKVRRIALGGRPMTVAFRGKDQAIVANYLLDAVQVVDVPAGKLARTIPLGSPARPAPARLGEALFYDARRSHNQWFSCHTCHVDGHTCGLNFDTLNDDSYGNPKLTPSLRGVTHTGPWTWHGWQKDLGASVEKSFTQTMYGPRPTAEESKSLQAFLATLEHPPRMGPGNREAVQRGRVIFEEKARCARCHHGTHYTAEQNYDVKLEPDGSSYRLWNPPTLRGLFDRGPYLHDGRAKTLDELLQSHHSSEKLGGPALTDAERRDLIEFLMSL